MTKASKTKAIEVHDAINCFVIANELTVTLMNWNDDPARTKEQVLEAFDKAINYAKETSEAGTN